MAKVEKKFDCYKCEYRGTIPGDCHSCCNHPLTGADDNILAQLMSGKFNKALRELNIEGSPHGIRSGWFMWPANFDPVWLENCDGFKQKGEQK